MSSCVLPGCKNRVSWQGRGMQSRQRGENEQKDRNEQKLARPGCPLSLSLPVCHQGSFIMPDKERLSGRLHGLLKRFANSSYNTPGKKKNQTLLLAGGQPQHRSPKDTRVSPVPKRCKIKEGQWQPWHLPLGQAAAGRGRQPPALLPPSPLGSASSRFAQAGQEQTQGNIGKIYP